MNLKFGRRTVLAVFITNYFVTLWFKIKSQKSISLNKHLIAIGIVLYFQHFGIFIQLNFLWNSLYIEKLFKLWRYSNVLFIFDQINLFLSLFRRKCQYRRNCPILPYFCGKNFRRDFPRLYQLIFLGDVFVSCSNN